MSSAIGALDYASVGALSSATVIPDLSGYATENFVASAISALDYASVGALSSSTVIPSLSGYATEVYVQNELSDYAKTSDLSNYTPLSEMSLYASVSYVESAISGLSSVYAQVSGTKSGNYWQNITINGVTGSFSGGQSNVFGQPGISL